jgi:2-hydroxy-6-oxonona-2,4-dienedioate hydrolase
MDTSPTDATPTPNATVVAHAVPAGGGRLHVADRPGREPAFVLMHGFPDDSRIYDRLTPLLAPGRVVAFDFMGYGRSDRPDPPSLDPARHQEALAAVLDALGLDRVALVAHDASGPVAIDFAVGNPDRVEQLVLLDTYYGHAPSLRFPEMIRLLADPRLTPLADAMMEDPDQRLWLLGHTARRFGLDPADPDGLGAVAVLPQFFGDQDQADAIDAVRAWTRELFDELEQHDRRIAEGLLGDLDLPVTLVAGSDDEYVGPGVARDLAGHFRHATAHVIDAASHWPQWDRPEAVAALLSGGRGTAGRSSDDTGGRREKFSPRR